MALGDRLAKLGEEVREDGCSFGKFVRSLPDETRSLLEGLLRSGISNQRLRHEIAQEGHRFSRDTIGDHRNGRCNCAAPKEDA